MSKYLESLDLEPSKVFRPLNRYHKPIWRVDDNTYQLVNGVKTGDVIMEKVLSTDFSIRDVLKTDPAFGIVDVIFNGPATIVKWTDGTKTVVKCRDEAFDKEKGLAMAICKKVMGNKGNYYNVIKKVLVKATLEK